MNAPDAKYFDDIVEAAFSLELPGNGSGSAHRSHPRWIHRGKLLLLSWHNTNNYCHAYVITDVSAKVYPGMNDSCANGDPAPRVSSGQMIEVYANGKWNAPIEGPWEQAIWQLLNELQVEIAVARESHETLMQQERALIENTKLNKYRALADSF